MTVATTLVSDRDIPVGHYEISLFFPLERGFRKEDIGPGSFLSPASRVKPFLDAGHGTEPRTVRLRQGKYPK